MSTTEFKEKTMQTDNPTQPAQSLPNPAQFTSLAMRSMGQLCDMNLAATRVLFQTQARAAAALGLPDWSGVFSQTDEQARQVFTNSAEQLVQATQRANEAAAELQRQISRVVEAQSSSMVQTVQQGLEQFGQQTEEGLNQLCASAREQADNTERVTQSLNDEVLQTLRQGSEGMRNAMRQGGEHLRENMRQGAEHGEQSAKAAAQASRNVIVDAHGQGIHSSNGSGTDDKARRNKGAAASGAQQPGNVA